MKQTIKEVAREAIHKHYNCNGTYPCSEREYCEHCNGHNTAFDCCECGADEFKEGFIAGANWRINSVWHDASEVPEERRFCIYIRKDGTYGYGYYHIEDNTIWYTRFADVVKWAYFQDITPNMEN